MMNGIDTILRRLDTDAKAEADAVLKKARQEAADITARYQAQAAQEAARLAARNEKAAEERVDQKAELAKRFKEARSMLDEIDAPADATPSGEKASSPEGI